ncbi:MAG: prolipoprotein diacylglyceryl transferase, partial [Myxococcales bacterium]|nr:prolipoprotein diacylglyceryl transferase [Myxococcales bacterium]
MIYTAFVALGVVLGFGITRNLGPEVALRSPAKVTYAALGGAVVGAFLLQLPADALGWSPEAETVTRWGGRTVLGGLLGGWLSVELMKRHIGHVAPTGDAFAVGLPLSLGMGRLGCVFAGCCPGVPLDASSPWARVSLALHDEPRFPATLL